LLLEVVAVVGPDLLQRFRILTNPATGSATSSVSGYEALSQSGRLLWRRS